MSGNRLLVQWEESRLLIRLPDKKVYVLDVVHLEDFRVKSLEQRQSDVDIILHPKNSAGLRVDAVLIPVAYAANAVVEPD